jgi:SAM-dependent methyltransferase
LGDDLPELPPDSLARILERLNPETCRDVLDLGCGYGRWSVALAREGFNLTSVDISPEALGILEDRARESSLQVRTVARSVDEYVNPDSYDLVLCVSVLDHMPLSWAERAVENIRLSLRRGGLLYATFDHLDPEDESKAFEILPDSTRLHTSGDEEGLLWRFFSNSEIEALLASFELLSFERAESGSRRAWGRKV